MTLSLGFLLAIIALICGAAAAAGFETEGRKLCAQHLQLVWDRTEAA